MRGSSNIYNLAEHLQARAMCAIIADTDRHRFAIGSSSVSATNEIHLVTYSEDANRIDCDMVFSLSDEQGDLPSYEVSQLSASPYNRSCLLAALAPTASAGGDSDPNKIVFYQVKEREAPAILEEMSPTALPADNEDGAAASGTPPEETKI